MDLSSLFRRAKQEESVAFIDLAADSVAGAYVRFEEGQPPTLLYTRRLPIEARTGEPPERGLFRALRVLGDALVREGAPVLLRSTGSGSVDAILVSADTPWQETRVQKERFERTEPFVFTRGMVTEALERERKIPPGKRLADESVIGTVLNGYETRNPYGRKVKRATVIVLTSYLEERIAEGVTSMIRSIFHARASLFIAGSSLRYQVIRVAFAPEREALILDATGPLVSVALVRGGLFVALSELPEARTRSWTEVVIAECASLAEQYPLPRTIFLLARDTKAEEVKQELSLADFKGLWLSDESPKIVPVLASHLVSMVRQASAAPPDLQLILMALFYQQRASSGARG